MKKLAFSPKDIHTLRNLILGGALIGGGAGALTSWTRQMRALNEQAERDEELQKSTIPLRLLRREAPAEEGQVKTASALAGSLGVAGGVVAGTTSYQLIRKLYDMFSRRETKKRLEDAQEGYEDELLNSIAMQDGHTKRAGDVTYSPDVLRVLPWLMGAGVPLTGYVAHLVTQRALDKAFPASNFGDNIADELGGRPVRIDNVKVPMRRGREERTEEDPELTAEDAALMKTAGVAEHLAGFMFVGPMLHAAMPAAAREVSPSWQWVKVAAHRPELLETLPTRSTLRDMEALSAQAPEPDFHSGLLANTLLLKHAGIGTQYGVLLASEAAELMPLTHAETHAASAGLKDRAVKMATSLGIGLLERTLVELASEDDPPTLVKNALLGTGGTVPDGSTDTTALKLLLQQMSKRKKVKLTPKAEHTQESKQADEGQG